jgi:hypothetical protein
LARPKRFELLTPRFVVFADRERVGAVHRADLGDWLAVHAFGRIVGVFAEEPAAVHAVLNAARRRA